MTEPLPPQYEDPNGATSIAMFKARVDAASAPGSLVGGAQILNFQRGWAMPILLIRAGRAHWFERSSRPQVTLPDGRVVGFADSLCGLESLLDLIHGAGNYPRCQLCIRAMSRRIKTGRL